MATVNKSSLRAEFDALKARFESLCVAGTMNRIEPAVTRPAASRPRITANASVLLPEPLSPTTARVSPARTVRSTSRTARTSWPRTK